MNHRCAIFALLSHDQYCLRQAINLYPCESGSKLTGAIIKNLVVALRYLYIRTALSNGKGSQSSPAREPCLSANSPYYHMVWMPLRGNSLLPMFEWSSHFKRPKTKKTLSTLVNRVYSGFFASLAMGEHCSWTIATRYSPYYHMISTTYGRLLTFPHMRVGQNWQAK